MRQITNAEESKKAIEITMMEQTTLHMKHGFIEVSSVTAEKAVEDTVVLAMWLLFGVSQLCI